MRHINHRHKYFWKDTCERIRIGIKGKDKLGILYFQKRCLCKLLYLVFISFNVFHLILKHTLKNYTDEKILKPSFSEKAASCPFWNGTDWHGTNGWNGTNLFGYE